MLATLCDVKALRNDLKVTRNMAIPIKLATIQ